MIFACADIWACLSTAIVGSGFAFFAMVAIGLMIDGHIKRKDTTAWLMVTVTSAVFGFLMLRTAWLHLPRIGSG